MFHGCIDQNLFQGCIDQNKANSDDNNKVHISLGLAAKTAPSQTDNMIANAFKEMSIEERERNSYEMHGVADAIDETADFVSKSLYELQQQVLHLLRIDPKLATAYQIAQQQDPQFVNDRLLRIRFLRSENFMLKRSAARMLRWFDWKRELFGDEKLCQEIGHDDLMPDDIALMRKGYLQRLPVRDRSGRSIIVAIHENEVYKSAKSFGRFVFYMLMPRREEPGETAGEILMGIYTKQSNLAAVSIQVTRMMSKSVDCCPIRHVGFHHCLSDSSGILFNAFLSSILRHLESQLTAKTKIHSGSFQETTYSMMTYGLPPNSIPVSESGMIKTKNHLEYLKMRRIRERMAAEGRQDMIDLPLNSDVLLGRGKPIQQHMGNLRLQAIIDEYLTTYIQSSKKAKTALANDIVKRVKEEAGSRFLSKDEGIWLEVPDEAAQEKVSKLFWSRKHLVPTTVNAGRGNMASRSRTPEVEADMERFERQPAAKRWKL